MPSPALRITIGGFEVVRALEAPGRELYLATKPGMPGEFVLAVFEVPTAHAKQLETEVVRARGLKHRAIMPITDVFEWDRKSVVAYESVPGVSLLKLTRQLEEQHERLSDGAVMYIAHNLMEALAEAHTARDDTGKMAPIVHGELAPHQLFLSWQGDVKVLGFGLTPMFMLSLLAETTPEWARPFIAPEVRSGGMLTPRANAYSGAAVIWSLFARKMPPEDAEQLPKLRELRPDLPPLVAIAVDRALDPSIRRRNTCQAVAAALTRAVKAEDAQDLRWSLEVLRAFSTIEEQTLPSDAFPPSLFPPAVTSGAPISSVLPDEDDEPTSPFLELPAELSHIKLPDSVLPPDDDASMPAPPSDDVTSDRSDLAAGAAAASSEPLPTPRVEKLKRRGTLKGLPEVKLDAATETGTARESERKLRRRRSEERQRRDADDKLTGDPFELDPEPAVAPKEPPKGRSGPLRFQKTAPGVGMGLDGDEQTALRPSPALAAKAAAGSAGAEAPNKPPPRRGEPAKGDAQNKAADKPLRQPSAAAKRAENETAAREAAKDATPRPDFDAALFDEITREKAPGERASNTMPAPSDPATPGADDGSRGAAGDDVRVNRLPPPPVFVVGADPFAGDAGQPPPSQGAPPSYGPPISQYPVGYITQSQAPGSMAPGSQAAWLNGPVTVAPLGSVIVSPDQVHTPGMLPMKWVVVVAITAVASFAMGLLVASGGVEVRISEGTPTPAATAQPAPTRALPPTPAASSAPAAPPTAQPSSSPAPEPLEAEVSDLDARDLPHNHGFLLVTSPAADGFVYLRGERVGVAGKPIEVLCGLHFVRVGNENTTKWYSAGRAVAVACQGVTKMNMPMGGGPVGNPGGSQFLKPGAVWTPGDL